MKLHLAAGLHTYFRVIGEVFLSILKLVPLKLRYDQNVKTLSHIKMCFLAICNTSLDVEQILKCLNVVREHSQFMTMGWRNWARWLGKIRAPSSKDKINYPPLICIDTRVPICLICFCVYSLNTRLSWLKMAGAWFKKGLLNCNPSLNLHRYFHPPFLNYQSQN